MMAAAPKDEAPKGVWKVADDDYKRENSHRSGESGGVGGDNARTVKQNYDF
jgi:hypothetical protein